MRSSDDGTHKRFDYNDASLEAQNARATAIDLIATWIGAEELEVGKPRGQFIRDELFTKVLVMDWRETAYLIGALTFVGSILARAAAQLPMALDELDLDAQDFTAEHGSGDPLGYLRGIELAIQQYLRGEEEGPAAT